MSWFSARVEKMVYIRVRVSFGVTGLGSCTVLSVNVDFLVERPRPIIYNRCIICSYTCTEQTVPVKTSLGNVL